MNIIAKLRAKGEHEHLAHSTADYKVLKNSENKLLPDGRGVIMHKSARTSKEAPVCRREQLIAVAVLESNCFVKLVAHDKTL